MNARRPESESGVLSDSIASYFYRGLYHKLYKKVVTHRNKFESLKGLETD